MNVEQLLAAMTPDVYERLRQAVETGKWPDGKVLSDEQKENCLQAVLLYQAKIAQTNEHMTVGETGEIIHKSKSELRRELRESQSNEQSIARFKQDDI
ncbi:YeaC family protein [Alteromonas lipolytica]|uniref:DUF1315 domain-containing protein n=1 Tax=Alteromonas lipolytica TaxID=1856405 RepID=A0A1E8FGE7_9ALTE|nr:DUF1315 family protein [Alteromonas lipolytica]OFI35015.1 hypothetical protein BFC17_15775 [Alteromonas lipolytica]GGF55913.1 transcriptional regulator [Alteromonas lipolytica]